MPVGLLTPYSCSTYCLSDLRTQNFWEILPLGLEGERGKE